MANRLDIKLGYKCNNNCLCCPAAHNKKLGDQSFEQIKKELRQGIKNKATEVVLTGGEPTVRPDILEIVRYCREIGYGFVQIQTNGRMFSYKRFCEQLVEAGVTEFGPSLHGPNPQTHDYFTQAPGAFKQVVRGIKNLRELNQRVIINSVITKFNYRLLPETAKLLVGLGVAQYQFAFPHLVGNARTNADLICPRKATIEPFVHKGLQVGIDAGIRAMVEAYPYCFLQGYEFCSSDLFMPRSDTVNSVRYEKNHDLLRRSTGKAKHEMCKECRFDAICEGPWIEYVQKFGWSEFKPVKGKKIVSKEDFFEEWGEQSG